MRITALVIWSVLVFATGAALFQIAFEVDRLEEDLTTLNREIVKEQESLHVLRAEWAFLTRPSRIRALSEELLPELGPPAIDQIVSVSETPEKPSVLNTEEPAPEVAPDTRTPGFDAPTIRQAITASQKGDKP